MTETEIEAEIAEVSAAITAVRKGGQSYTIGTGPSTRAVTMVDYNALVKERRELQGQLEELQGDAGMPLTAGW